MKNYVVILASGTGERLGGNQPKQFMSFGGKTILEHSIDAFEKHEQIDEIILVSHKDYLETCKSIVVSNNYTKISRVVAGGSIRRESACNGISEIKDVEAKILIHDAVRPLVSERIITDCVNALDSHDAVAVAVAATDTIVRINKENIIEEIPERSTLMCNQTPQAFKLSTIKRAHDLAKQDGQDIAVTDDCGLILYFDLVPIYVVEGDILNIKITYPHDIEIAEKLFMSLL